jgi:hypothetical protein
MRQGRIAVGQLPASVNGAMHSKRFVDELRDWGFTPDEAIDTLCLLFGLSRGAAELFILSHPTWAAEAGADDSRRSTGGGRMAPPNSN